MSKIHAISQEILWRNITPTGSTKKNDTLIKAISAFNLDEVEVGIEAELGN